MVAIVVYDWYSQCGECGRDCDPKELNHDTLLGYGPDNGKPGCGAEFTHLEMGGWYGRDFDKAAQALRPDLPLKRDTLQRRGRGMKEFQVFASCQMCGQERVDEMGDICAACQYEVITEAVLDAAYIYREHPENDALREELFDALDDYEQWFIVDTEEDGE